MKDIEGVLGRGWFFPPSFSPENGVMMATDYQRIQQSLHILFATLPGERIMREAFGCDLHQFMFQNIGDELVSRISRAIEDAIRRDEPRVELTSLDLQPIRQMPSQLSVRLTYRVRGEEDTQSLRGALNLMNGNAGGGPWVS